MKQLLRSLTILKVFAKYRLDTFIEDLNLPLFVCFWLYLLPWRYFIPASRPRAERLRLAIEALGPVFIKFGQMLSKSRAFSVCMAKKVFKLVCIKSPGDEDNAFIEIMADELENNDNYNMKNLFIKTVAKCVEDRYED